MSARRPPIRSLALLVALLGAGCFDAFDTLVSSGEGGHDNDVDDPHGAGGQAQGGGLASGGATSTPPSMEACANGADDDQDGGADCDDDECSGNLCVERPMGAVAGPLLLLPAGATECPVAFSGARSTARRMAAPCGCACGAPSGEGCQAHVSGYSDGACTTLTSSAVATPASCAATVSGLGARVTLSAGGGSCAGALAGGPAGDDEERTLCASAAAGCADGAACVRPVPASDGLICYAFEGDAACSGMFEERHVLYDAAAPPTCGGACSCEPSTGGTCSGTVTLRNPSCTDPGVSVAGDGSCAPANFTAATVSGVVSAAGSCAPTSPFGALGGSFTTLCCASTL